MKELMKYMHRNEALIVVRFFDRLVTKASVGTIGCYTITDDNQLIISVRNLYEEITYTIPEVEDGLYAAFKDQRNEWRLPTECGAYLCHKWAELTNDDLSSSFGNEDSDDSRDSEAVVQPVELDDSKCVCYNDKFAEIERLQEDGCVGREQLTVLRRHCEGQSHFVMQKMQKQGKDCDSNRTGSITEDSESETSDISESEDSDDPGYDSCTDSEDETICMPARTFRPRRFQLHVGLLYTVPEGLDHGSK